MPRSGNRPTNTDPVHFASTGTPGLDDILMGGLARNRLYLVEGVPGAGKTTLALQFLLDGARRGEPVLYITLSETAEELKAVADSHGWDLTGVTVRELLPQEDTLDADEQYTMFHPSEVELATTTKLILQDVDALKPTRVVLRRASRLPDPQGRPRRVPAPRRLGTPAGDEDREAAI